METEVGISHFNEQQVKIATDVYHILSSDLNKITTVNGNHNQWAMQGRVKLKKLSHRLAPVAWLSLWHVCPCTCLHITSWHVWASSWWVNGWCPMGSSPRSGSGHWWGPENEAGHYAAPRGTQGAVHLLKVWKWFWGFHPGTLPTVPSVAGYHWLWHGGLCSSPRICLPRRSLTHHQTSHAWWCRPHNIHHHPLPHLPHVLSLNLLSSVKITGCQRQTSQFWCCPVNGTSAALWWAVSTGHNRGHDALMSSSWSLFLTVRLEKYTQVACWRSFCRVSCSGPPVCPCTKEHILVLLLDCFTSTAQSSSHGVTGSFLVSPSCSRPWCVLLVIRKLSRNKTW